MKQVGISRSAIGAGAVAISAMIGFAVAGAPANAQSGRIGAPSALRPSAVIPSAVYTGVIQRIVGPVTVVIARDAPAAASSFAPGDRAAKKGDLVTVRLWGVVPPGAGTHAAEGARRVLSLGVGRRVRVVVRGGATAANGPAAAMMYVLPDNAGGTLTAPPPLSEQKAPPVALVPTRSPDASNMIPNLPGGADHPNLPTSTTLPQPAPAAAVRADDALNVAVIRQGFATWDWRHAGNAKELQDAQRDAQKAHRGMWANSAVEQ